MKSTYGNPTARCRAYAGSFNIDLFNAAAQLAITTTEAPKQVKEVQHRLNRLPWYERGDASAYFEPQGIRYFGELLERYGEKMGDDISNTRAIALAMGWCAPLLTENMFVVKQRQDFMKKLSANTDDLYVTVARYLLAEDVDRRTLHDTLLVWGYKATEEITSPRLRSTADSVSICCVVSSREANCPPCSSGRAWLSSATSSTASCRRTPGWTCSTLTESGLPVKTG